VSVWRSVCRAGGFLGDGSAGGPTRRAMVVFSVLAASSALTESRLMGAAEAIVDDADGVVGEQGVGSADVGQCRDVPLCLVRNGVCHECAARIAVQSLDGRVFPIYADARAAAAAITARLSPRTW
jgi:hypothetical protein